MIDVVRCELLGVKGLERGKVGSGEGEDLLCF